RARRGDRLAARDRRVGGCRSAQGFEHERATEEVHVLLVVRIETRERVLRQAAALAEAAADDLRLQLEHQRPRDAGVVAGLLEHRAGGVGDADELLETALRGVEPCERRLDARPRLSGTVARRRGELDGL